MQNVNFEYISGRKILYSMFNSGVFLCVLPRRLCCALCCAVETENKKKQAYKRLFFVLCKYFMNHTIDKSTRLSLQSS